MIAVVLFCVSLFTVIAFCVLGALAHRNHDSESTPQPSPRTPSEDLQTVQVTTSQRRTQPPSQVQPSAPPEAELKDDRERLVKECLFRRRLEHGDSVAFIQSILAAAQDRPSLSSERSSTSLPAKLECSICLDGYKTGNIICWSKTNECDHIFHSKCIQTWMIQNGNDDCPLCRTNLMSFHSVA